MSEVDTQKLIDWIKTDLRDLSEDLSEEEILNLVKDGIDIYNLYMKTRENEKEAIFAMTTHIVNQLED